LFIRPIFHAWRTPNVKKRKRKITKIRRKILKIYKNLNATTKLIGFGLRGEGGNESVRILAFTFEIYMSNTQKT